MSGDSVFTLPDGVGRSEAVLSALPGGVGITFVIDLNEYPQGGK